MAARRAQRSDRHAVRRLVPRRRRLGRLAVPGPVACSPGGLEGGLAPRCRPGAGRRGPCGHARGRRAPRRCSASGGRRPVPGGRPSRGAVAGGDAGEGLRRAAARGGSRGSGDDGAGCRGSQRGARGEPAELVVGLADGVAEHPVDRALAAEDGQQAFGEPVVRARSARSCGVPCGGAAAAGGAAALGPVRGRPCGPGRCPCVVRCVRPVDCAGPVRPAIPGGNFCWGSSTGRARRRRKRRPAVRRGADEFTYPGDGPRPQGALRAVRVRARGGRHDGRRGGRPEGGPARTYPEGVSDYESGQPCASTSP